MQPESAAAFRRWLEEHHEIETAVWLVYAKKHSGRPSITWSEAVDEALCHGWIDSKAQRIDDDHYEQYFTRRKRGSPWSRINKAKIAELERTDRLAPAGRAVVEAAQEDGSWSILDEVEALIVPDDLARAFSTDARRNFDALAPSRRRNVLQWIVLARRDDTRAKRILATAAAAAEEGRAPNGI